MLEASVGRRAASLPWLCPAAPALVALADVAPDARILADDPAVVLLVLRFVRSAQRIETFRLDPTAFSHSVIGEAASTFLAHAENCWADPTTPEAKRIRGEARRTARTAARLAEASGTCSPVAAYAIGLLTPLADYALATIDPQLTIRDTGMIVDDLARRLARHWKLPEWFAATLTTLALPMADAIRLGADEALSRVVRHAMDDGEIVADDAITAVPPRAISVDAVFADENPRSLPLLPKLLRTAAHLRRANRTPTVAALEDQIDRLHGTLASARMEFDRALQDAKLTALAEFAAGAGHEINNPLTVISGHAQLLRSRDADPERQKALDTIIRQTRRVADLLQDVMQFARPAPPAMRFVSVEDVLATVRTECGPAADAKGVQLQFDSASMLSRVFGDPAQLRRIVANLVRNAVEATSAGDRVTCRATDADGEVQIVVEDTGPGPADEVIAHMFDPFYSGRSAGRGRGLGLSTAWRFAKQNGADIRFEPDEGLTRFVLSLPKATADRDRKSA